MDRAGELWGAGVGAVQEAQGADSIAWDPLMSGAGSFLARFHF